MIARTSALLAMAAIASCTESTPHQTADGGSANTPAVPAPLAELAQDALRAAAEVKQSGNIDSVLTAHALSPAYRDALRNHLLLMKKLHEVAVESKLRYPAYELTFLPAEFCSSAHAAKLLLRGVSKFTMESIPPNSGMPGYTAAGEEHIFEFVKTDTRWIMSSHHEISLAEMHEPSITRLRHPCAGALD